MTWPTFQQRLQQMVEMVMMVVLVEMVMRIRKEEIRVKEKLYIYRYSKKRKRNKSGKNWKKNISEIRTHLHLRQREGHLSRSMQFPTTMVIANVITIPTRWFCPPFGHRQGYGCRASSWVGTSTRMVKSYGPPISTKVMFSFFP